MKKTKVICSIGPASDSAEVMGEMVNRGMDCARINLSHATPESIVKTLEVIRQVRREYNQPVAVMYDTKGPEFRTLKFKDGGVSLKKGDTIRMSATCILGDEKEFGVNHSNAIDFINVGDKVLIDNALLELEVIQKDDGHVLLKALGDGKIQDKKTINVPGVDLNLEFMSEVDKTDIAFAAKHACDYLALSFVKSVREVRENAAAGHYLILVFSFALASSLDLTTLRGGLLHTAALLGAVTVCSFFLHALLCRVFRIDADCAIVTMTAGLYGPAFIPAVTKQLRNDELTAPGLICGALGYAVGTLLGAGIFYLL